MWIYQHFFERTDKKESIDYISENQKKERNTIKFTNIALNFYRRPGFMTNNACYFYDRSL